MNQCCHHQKWTTGNTSSVQHCVQINTPVNTYLAMPCKWTTSPRNLLYCMCCEWGRSFLTFCLCLFPLWNYRNQTRSLHTVHSVTHTVHSVTHTVHSVTAIQIIAMAMLSVESCDLWCPNENTQLHTIWLSTCTAIHLCTSQLWKPFSRNTKSDNV
jgi:hypothetical protein